MIESQRNRIRFLGEQGYEMNVQIMAFVIFDICCEVWVGVDAVFVFSPVEVVEPMVFGICDPVARDTVAAVDGFVGVLVVWRCNWREFEQGLEVLELLLVDVGLERLDFELHRRGRFAVVCHCGC